MQYRKLGKTGLDISALGFGAMRFPMTDTETVNEKEAIRLIRYAIDQGVNYIDTAYPYHNRTSETIVGKALLDGYREKTYIATKCPVWLVQAEDDFDRILEEQLTKLQTDCIDFYLLHALSKERIDQHVKPYGLIEKMIKAKEAGKIRYIGFSFHDEYEVFKDIVDMRDVWDFCQIQYNYININDQAGVKGLKYAAEKGLGVIVMEPLLGGRLANLTPHLASGFPEDKSAVEYALDFLWDQPEVSLLLSGMGNEQQVMDNLAYASRSGIGMVTAQERECYKKVKEEFDKMALVGCTACGYCMPCPFGLSIPDIFAAYNKTASHGRNEAAKLYEKLETKADSCMGCCQCEKECPQNIKISQIMPKVAEKFK